MMGLGKELRVHLSAIRGHWRAPLSLLIACSNGSRGVVSFLSSFISFTKNLLYYIDIT